MKAEEIGDEIGLGSCSGRIFFALKAVQAVAFNNFWGKSGSKIFGRN